MDDGEKKEAWPEDDETEDASCKEWLRSKGPCGISRIRFIFWTVVLLVGFTVCMLIFFRAGVLV